MKGRLSMRRQEFFRYAAMALCVGVFITGSSIHVIRQVNAGRSNQPYAARDYVATLLEYSIDSQGKKTLIAVRVKEVQTDGTLTERVSWVGRNRQMTIHRDANGVTVTDGKTVRVVENLEGKEIPESVLNFPKQAHTVAYYEKHPGLMGTEIVAGLKVYTIRTKTDETDWDDRSYSPETGGCFIKLLHHDPDGSKVLVEAVKIEFK